MTETTKTCTDCGVDKPRAEFYDRKANCKECYRAHARAHRKPRTPAQRAEYRRRSGETNVVYRGKAYVECVASIRAAAADFAAVERQEAQSLRPPARGSAEWYEVASPEDLAAYRLECRDAFRKRYRNNLESERARVARYKLRNAHRVAGWEEKRQALLARGVLTHAEMRRMRQSATECAYCGHDFSESEATIDHIIAHCRGGEHAEHNVVVACRACNESKGIKTIEDWCSLLPDHQARRVLALYEQRYGLVAQAAE